MAHSDLLQLFGKQTSESLDLDQLCEPMQHYIETCKQYTDAKPGFLLTAWLPFVAANAGNRLYMFNNSSRIYPNIWSCIIGPSSVSRKTTALNYAAYSISPFERELLDGPLKEYELNTLVLTGTTLSKLMSYLALNPNRLFVHHEISAWLAEMNKAFNAGYRQIVTEIFDGVNRTVSNQERTEKIVNPALSIAAATTEGWLFRNFMDSADQMSGFMQRMIFYVVKNVPFEELNLDHREGHDLPALLADYDARHFQYWRTIPGQFQLRLKDEASGWKTEQYRTEYQRFYALGNDNIMSYFTRVYDNYFYKFCMLIWLLDMPENDWRWLRENCDQFEWLINGCPLELQQVQQAWYLCRFYMANTLPLINIMDEKDKLASERKVMDLLIQKFHGLASHSALLNATHMRKKDFKDAIESLLEREAIVCEAGRMSSNRTIPKQYRAHRDIVDSWSGGAIPAKRANKDPASDLSATPGGRTEVQPPGQSSGTADQTA